jgi:plasmid stabilization system protein ParE
MRVLWTKKAIAGWREVADYILADFGAQSMQAFIERTVEAEGIISLLPSIGSVEWSDTQEGVVYRYVTINRRSKMLYYVDGDIIFIADFWDVRKNK